MLRLRGGSFPPCPLYPPYPMCMPPLGYQHQCFPNIPYQCFPALMYNSPLSNGPIIIVPLQNFQQMQTPTDQIPSQQVLINELSPEGKVFFPDANSTFIADSNVDQRTIDPISDSPFGSPPFKSSFNQARLHKMFYPHIPKKQPRPVEEPKAEEPKEMVFHSMAEANCTCSDESVSEEHNNALSIEEVGKLESEPPETEEEIQRREIEEFERQQQQRRLRYMQQMQQQQMQEQSQQQQQMRQQQQLQQQQFSPDEETKRKEVLKQLFLLGLDNELKARQAELVQNRFLDIYTKKHRPPKMKVHNTFM
ncbi:putative uncharacterized protein DDB_G0288537 isoform X2 [Tribolium madens]|nr:putative uncharacterized protein DDB_G0288537 isoform X2 [Tribolium madens]